MCEKASQTVGCFVFFDKSEQKEDNAAPEHAAGIRGALVVPGLAPMAIPVTERVAAPKPLQDFEQQIVSTDERSTADMWLQLEQPTHTMTHTCEPMVMDVDASGSNTASVQSSSAPSDGDKVYFLPYCCSITSFR